MSDDITMFDESAARQLDNDIRALARHVHIALEALMVLVAEAQANDIHTHLGFPSWTAYLADALDGQWRIERDKRGEIVQFLAGQGMSQRAISKITGIGKGTVYRELAGAPLGQVITGLDGKTYTRLELGAPSGAPEESDDDFLARMAAEADERRRNGVTPLADPPDDQSDEEWLARLVEIEKRIDQHDSNIRRLQRIKFDNLFTLLRMQPPGAIRDAREFGLWMRWHRIKAEWGLEDGLSIDQIADAMGASVPMVQDYLDSPTSNDREFFAKIRPDSAGAQ